MKNQVLLVFRPLRPLRPLRRAAPPALSLITLLLTLGVALPARASFHAMQIEQVIGGVNGDTTAQAIQLRMRSGGQDLVSQARLVAYDAAGTNPVVLKDLTTDVANGTAGARVLIASANFANHTSVPLTPDFTLSSLIPASYLSAGRITYEDDAGTVYWSLSFGAGYTGATTGAGTNDADGNFGPSFGGPLPSSSVTALLFKGAASALSTNNAADYDVTAGAATFTNNAGASATVTGGNTTPSLAVSNAATRNEGDPGSNGSTTFTVTLSPASLSTVTVHFQTTSGTATQNVDYTARSGTLTFSPNQTSKTVTVSFIGDTDAELNETLFMDLKTPVNATIADSRGSAYIKNDDGPRIIIDNAPAIFEGDSSTSTSPQTFNVHLSEPSGDTITVDYATSNNTATAGSDYVARSGRLTFEPGMTSLPVVVQVKGDTTAEPTENYRVRLTRPTFAVLGDSQGTAYIKNDDGTPGAASTPGAAQSDDEPSE